MWSQSKQQQQQQNEQNAMPQSVMMLKSFNSERVCTGRTEGSDVATTPINNRGKKYLKNCNSDSSFELKQRIVLTDITNVTNCHLCSYQQRVLLRLIQYATSECQICLIFQEVCPAAYLMIFRSAILIFWLKILWAPLPVFPQSVPGKCWYTCKPH